jgi:glutathione S-transferase
MLTIWGRADSSNVQAAMWTVGELGLAHRRLDVGHRFGGNKDASFLAMNPNGTVPVLQDGDATPLFESAAIMRYLADRYGDAPFWPKDSAARAQVDVWAEWAKINVAANFTVPIFWGVVRTAPSRRDWSAITQAIKKLSTYFQIAERRLERHAYLCGDAFTLADIQFGHVLYRWFSIEIERPDFAAIGAYCTRLCARPAFKDHVMVSYEALRVHDPA